MTAIADASGDASALWPWHVWALIAILTAAIYAVWRILDSKQPFPTPKAEPEPTGCNATNPHRMLPTATGWRCANQCGEAWYIDPTDALATADLALWEIENDWQVEA
jgi:hypothetical protein